MTDTIKDVHGDLRVTGNLILGGRIQPDTKIATHGVRPQAASSGSLTHLDFDRVGLGNDNVLETEYVNLTLPVAGQAQVGGNLKVTQNLVVDGTIKGNLEAGTVQAGDLADNAVTTNAVADGAITRLKLAGNSVDATKIIDGSVGSNELADSAVIGPKLAANSVDGSKIVDGSIGPNELATAAVSTLKLADAAVTGAKLAPNSVDGTKIVDGSIGQNELAATAVATAKLADAAVTGAKLAPNSVDATKISDGSIGESKLATAAVATAKLADAAVTAPKLAVNSIDATKIVDGGIGVTKLANGAVTSEKLADNSVTGVKIVDGSVGPAKLVDSAVTNQKLADNSVGASKYIDASIGSGKLAQGIVTTAKLADGAVTNGKLDAGVQQAIAVGVDHANTPGNPHGTTADQVGALSTGGGTVNGTLAVVTPATNETTGFWLSPPTGGTALLFAAVTDDNTYGAFVGSTIGTETNHFEGATTFYGAVVFTGSVTFQGGKSGYVVDRFINADESTMRTGDVVKLRGSPVARFEGQLNRLPVSEVVLADKDDDPAVIGIVHLEVPPNGRDSVSRTASNNPTVIPQGGELLVVTLGAFAHCKVDASEVPIEVGDLLTTSAKPGFAKKAINLKPGSIIGKAMEPLKEGTGHISVFVNLR